MLRRLNLFQYLLPCCLLGILLMGLGGKLWLIHNFGTPVADPAQWQAGVPALAPEWAAGNVVLAHADNPVALPLLARAVLGALIHANHQWDDRVTNIVNALLLAGTFAALLAVGARRLGWTALWASALCAGTLLALPLNWTQSLAGSALPDRLAMFFGFPAVWLLLDRELRSPLWLPAAGSLLLASTAADWAVTLSASVGLVATVRMFTTRVRRGRDVAAIALAGLGLGVHLWLFPQRGIDPNWPELGTLVANLSAPWSSHPWLALVIQAPLAIRIIMSLRDDDRKHSMAPFTACGVAAFLAVLWISTATASGMPAGRHGPQDIVLLMTALSFATLTQLWSLNWRSVAARSALSAAWVAVLVAGLNLQVERAVGGELPRQAKTNAEAADAFASKLEEQLPRHLAAIPPELLGAADPAQLSALLASPRLRHVLPFSLQPAVPIEKGPATTSNFGPLQADQFSLPPPPNRAWAGGPSSEADGDTVFISLPLPPSAAGVLRFKVAGDLGTASFPFALRSASTGEVSTLVLDDSTGERWRTVNLPRPPDPVVLVVGPASLGAWGAFTDPVEMGTLSWFAGKLAKNWYWFAGTGSLLLAAALLLPFAPRATRRDTFALAPDGRIVRIGAEELT